MVCYDDDMTLSISGLNMSNDPATTKAFTNWEKMAQSNLGKTIIEVVSDAVVRGDVATADPAPPTPEPESPRPTTRRPGTP